MFTEDHRHWIITIIENRNLFLPNRFPVSLTTAIFFLLHSFSLSEKIGWSIQRFCLEKINNLHITYIPWSFYLYWKLYSYFFGFFYSWELLCFYLPALTFILTDLCEISYLFGFVSSCYCRYLYTYWNCNPI